MRMIWSVVSAIETLGICFHFANAQSGNVFHLRFELCTKVTVYKMVGEMRKHLKIGSWV